MVRPKQYNLDAKQWGRIIEYYQQGNSIVKTAERFGMSKYVINDELRARGLTRNRGFQRKEEPSVPPAPSEEPIIPKEEKPEAGSPIEDSEPVKPKRKIIKV